MVGIFRRSCVLAVFLCGLSGLDAVAQTPAPVVPPNTAPDTGAPPLPPPRGEVIIQSHGEAPADSADPAAAPRTLQKRVPLAEPADTAKVDVTDADRSALLITAYDLDTRLMPESSGLSVRARVTVKNESSGALKQLALQISSTLHWDSAILVNGAERVRLPLSQHQLDTDADHTGAETEAILPLPKPLGPGASAALDLFYSGTVPQNAGRLARLGATATQQQSSDWDAISSNWTGLRGFGNVLWYPVASPQLFLADGNALFAAVGRARRREENINVHLRLSVQYAGEPPVAAYFCGRREQLKAVSDSPDAPVAAGSGIATTDFPTGPLGFRTLSLFVLQEPEVFAGGETAGLGRDSQNSTGSSPGAAAAYSSSAPGGDSPVTSPVTTPGQPRPEALSAPAASAAATGFLPGLVGIVSSDTGAADGFSAAADHVSPLLREWLGPQPLSALTAVDHAGQPFQDGPLLVAPLAVLQASSASATLVQSLTHAWVQTGQPWVDDGLAQFFALLWTERESGRNAAVAQLTDLMSPVSLAEPDPETAGSGSGEPLISATDDVFYRRKAAAVWWMLRGIVGDGNLHQALAAWRVQPASQDPPEAQAVAFQHLLERLSGQQLGWFFNDWVLQDRGLPDLGITDVGVAQEAAGAGHSAGWLVAVSVRNEGGAVAEVPLIVRSGPNQIVRSLRIPGQTTVTQRVFVENAPTSVVVNDGSTPELRTSTHTREVKLETR